MNPILQAFMSLATAGRSKTTVLKPLAWKLALLIMATVMAFHYDLPYWVGTAFAVCALLTVLLHGYSYIYFMHKNPEMLRTESFSLQRIALERGVSGDSLSGISDVTEVREPRNVTGQGVAE